MENTYSKIQELLHQKADYQARLNLIPYEGTPEIKGREGQKYLYMRKRMGIAGPFLVVELCEEDFTSLSKEHREKYTKIFEFPEKFFRIGEEIYALPIKMPEHT